MQDIACDRLFRKKRKSGTFKIVDAPSLNAPLADSHAHLQMLDNPALAIARAAAHKVDFIETIVDPAEDGMTTFSDLDLWKALAEDYALDIVDCDGGNSNIQNIRIPQIRIAVGVHPHNAKDLDDHIKGELIDDLHDARVSALGEIGLDYHYDFSPRDIQRQVFEQQIEIANQAGLPVVLHIREAFDDAFSILCNAGFPDAGVLLHCYTSDANEISRWVDEGCYIAFGGALTFASSDGIREAVSLVPKDRLLLETDSPYMTPVPLRGEKCEVAHIVFTASVLCDLLGYDTSSMLLNQIFENTIALLDRDTRFSSEGTTDA